MKSDHAVEEDDETNQMNKGRRKKCNRKRLSIQTQFFFPSLLLSLVFQLYFVFSFILGSEIAEKVKIFIPELVSTNYVQCQLGLSANVITQMLIDPTFKIMGRDSLELMKEAMVDNYKIISNLQREHSMNLALHNDFYKEHFDFYMENNNLCNYTVSLQSNLALSACNDFMDGAFTKGLSVALPRYLEEFRTTFFLHQYHQAANNLTQSTITMIQESKSYDNIQRTQFYYIIPLF